MLQIKFSNRFEFLLDSLLEAMARPPKSPFVQEEIIVPSAAILRRIASIGSMSFFNSSLTSCSTSMSRASARALS